MTFTFDQSLSLSEDVTAMAHGPYITRVLLTRSIQDQGALCLGESIHVLCLSPDEGRQLLAKSRTFCLFLFLTRIPQFHLKYTAPPLAFPGF